MFWIAHDKHTIHSGEVTDGTSVTTGLPHLETYPTAREQTQRLIKLRENYPAALAEWIQTKRLQDPRAKLADYRWQRETGGITLPTGIFVRTDRETQSRLVESFTSVQSGLLSAPIKWKLTSGEWVTLSIEELGFIIAAVSNHVRNCFEAERLVEQRYIDGTVTDVITAFDEELENLK